MIKILYFGSFDPEYSRNRVLIRGLRENGVDVSLCYDNSPYIFKYINLFLRHLKHRGRYDAMIVGFPGQKVMLLARLLTSKPIIFDVFTSHYGGYILDRKKFRENSLMATWYKWLDRKSVSISDVALLDTDAHIDFFVENIGLSRSRFMKVLVGTDSEVFYPRDHRVSTDRFIVHFHGGYIPLQGVKCIIKAAKILENENIQFNLIGRGQTYSEDYELARGLNIKNIEFIDRVSYNKLADYITGSDICLGIFGDTPKTDLVIPNKIYEALGCGKAIITSDTAAIRELLTNEENVLTCNKADAVDLADKILRLKNEPELRLRLEAGSRLLFSSKLKEIDIVANLLSELYESRILSK